MKRQTVRLRKRKVKSREKWSFTFFFSRVHYANLIIYLMQEYMYHGVKVLGIYYPEILSVDYQIILVMKIIYMRIL